MGGRASLVWVVIALVSQPSLPARADDLAAAVKAAYLPKLAPFVTWPSAELPAADSPLVLCVQASTDFATLVERAAAGQEVGGHPIVARRIAKFGPAMNCQMAYVAGAPGQTPAQALSALAGEPVLTVTDEAHGDARGIIHLVIDKGHVRFAVDPARARASRLEISSKLLAIASEVSR